jgi:hypothetical protein
MKIQEIIENLEYHNCYWSIDKHPEFGYSIRMYKKKNLKVKYIKIFTGKTLQDCILDCSKYLATYELGI